MSNYFYYDNIDITRDTKYEEMIEEIKDYPIQKFLKFIHDINEIKKKKIIETEMKLEKILNEKKNTSINLEDLKKSIKFEA